MKKNMLLFSLLFLFNLGAQDLPKKLTALKTSLVNLKDALSGKPDRSLPKTPDEVAAEKFIAQPLRPTRDDFKDTKGKQVHGWYGIIQQAGPDKGKFGIYIPKPKSGALSIDNFFDNKSGVLVYPWEQGEEYTLFVLYDPNGSANQNKHAKKLYETHPK